MPEDQIVQAHTHAEMPLRGELNVLFTTSISFKAAQGKTYLIWFRADVLRALF